MKKFEYPEVMVTKIQDVVTDTLTSTDIPDEF